MIVYDDAAILSLSPIGIGNDGGALFPWDNGVLQVLSR